MPGPITRTRYGEAVPQSPCPPAAACRRGCSSAARTWRRPQQDLVAANAQIGVAKAALFPNISLTGSAGSLSVPFNNLFTRAGRRMERAA